MKRVETVATPVAAPAEATFAFLADIGNLPRWATEFCRRLERADDRYYVETPRGRVRFAIRADARTGVVDMIAGGSDDRETSWPCRVVPHAPDGSLVLFTAIQDASMDDADFDAQLASLRREMTRLQQLVPAETGRGANRSTA